MCTHAATGPARCPPARVPVGPQVPCKAGRPTRVPSGVTTAPTCSSPSPLWKGSRLPAPHPRRPPPARGWAGPEQPGRVPRVGFLSRLLHLTALTCFQVRKIRASCLMGLKPRPEDKGDAEIRSQRVPGPVPCVLTACAVFSGSVCGGGGTCVLTEGARGPGPASLQRPTRSDDLTAAILLLLLLRGCLH